VFEQDFLEVGDPDQGDRYVLDLLEADSRRNALGEFGQTGGLFMGDQINISGSQVGAVGDGNTVTGNTFQQLWGQISGDIDLDALADELARLRAAVVDQDNTPEQAVALGATAQAEIAARSGGPSPSNLLSI
jgi:hypothetical protein